ncbi:MAG: hypothetical protein KDD42_06150, partial [Bdellovibrionales bacterium]|nr:hypothetical protein [Bdellovibrionales bacterium]
FFVPPLSFAPRPAAEPRLARATLADFTRLFLDEFFDRAPETDFLLPTFFLPATTNSCYVKQ